MPKIAKADIKMIPFEHITPKLIEPFLISFPLKKYAWVMPQLLAELAGYRLPPKNEEDKYDALDFLELNLRDNPRALGLYHLITGVPRGSIVGTQTSPLFLPYSALVPLYMAAQKRYNNVPYKSWANAYKLMDAALKESIVYDGTHSKQALIDIRTKGLEGKNPKTFNALLKVSDTELAQCPRLARTILCQFWCAHPDNRTDLMILDLDDWDNMPEPLVPSDPLISATGKAKYKDMPMPWDPQPKKEERMPWE